jgi:hypothetical protein
MLSPWMECRSQGAQGSAMRSWSVLGSIATGFAGCSHGKADPANPHIAPVSRMMAQGRCEWALGWTDQIAGSDLVLQSLATQTP